MNLFLTKFFRDYLLAKFFYIFVVLFLLPITSLYVDFEQFPSFPIIVGNVFLYVVFFIAFIPSIVVIGKYWKKVYEDNHGYVWSTLIVLFLGKYVGLLILFLYSKRNELERFTKKSIDLKNGIVNFLLFFIVLIGIDYAIAIAAMKLSMSLLPKVYKIIT